MSKTKMTLADFVQAKGFTVGELTQFGVREGQGGIVIPYYDQAGNEYIKFRIRDSAEDGKGFRWSAGDAELLPYGVHRPIPYTKGFVWIVEGESDCWTLWLNQIPALGLPGASAVKPLHAKYLEGVNTVAVIREPGEAGSRFPTRVANKLYDEGFTGKVFSVELPAKDPRSLYLEDPQTFRSRLADAFKARAFIALPPAPAQQQLLSFSLGELLEQPQREVEWLVDGLIPVGGIAMLAAKPKVGKSVLARNMALAIARGERFLGRITHPGMVLWLALEEQQDQVVGAFRSMGAGTRESIRLHCGSKPDDALNWLLFECRSNPISLIVIDTWHKFTRVEEINSYSAVNLANEPLMRLSRDHGIAQLWLHHDNKGQAQNGDQVLGSSALFAAADVLLSMKRAVDGVRTISSIQRIGTDMEDTVIGMDPDTLLIHSDGSKYTVQVLMAKRQVERALANTPLTRDELCASVEGRKQVIIAALQELLAEGVVAIHSGTGKRGSPIRYWSAQSSALTTPTNIGDYLASDIA